MNDRGPVRAQQRKAHRKRQHDKVDKEDRESEEGSETTQSAGTSDVIQVQQPQSRRRQVLAPAPNSSPSAGPAARTTARRGGKGTTGRRVTRPTRSRGVGRRR